LNVLTFGSVCSGIEAASVAWLPLGFRAAWLSEIAPFQSALLAHHYPDVPNLGDMELIDVNEQTADIDVLIGGTPCQAFSVAGLRKSLEDERGNLSLAFCRLARRIAEFGRLKFVVWENVPGCLNTSDNAFGCILAGLVGEPNALSPAGKKWTNAGCVYGPEGAAAWRVLDAQYFGLAQRRKRVFVVFCPGTWTDPAKLLFEFEGVRRDSPPSRTSGQGVAASLTRGADSGGRGGYAGRRREDDVNLVAALTASGRGVQRVGEIRGQDPLVVSPITCTPGGIAGTVRSKWSKGTGGPAGDEHYNLIAHSLRAEGFDASEDGTGRGTPLVPVSLGDLYKCGFCSHTQDHIEHQDRCPVCGDADYLNLMIRPTIGPNAGMVFDFDSWPQQYVAGTMGAKHGNVKAEHAWTGQLIPFDTTQITSPIHRAKNESGEPCHTLAKGQHPPAVAYQCQGTNVGEMGTLRGGNGNETGGVPFMQQQFGVRRLTPRECERLQGFQDNYTAVPYRGKPAADGPRYQALGNSMAVPVIRWIGRRLMEVM
jgi:DNA (cytosine-5)-methyltransferase 1